MAINKNIDSKKLINVLIYILINLGSPVVDQALTALAIGL